MVKRADEEAIELFEEVIANPELAVRFAVFNADRHKYANAFDTWELGGGQANNLEIGSAQGFLRGAMEVAYSIDAPLSMSLINDIRTNYFYDSETPQEIRRYGNHLAVQVNINHRDNVHFKLPADTNFERLTGEQEILTEKLKRLLPEEGVERAYKIEIKGQPDYPGDYSRISNLGPEKSYKYAEALINDYNTINPKTEREIIELVRDLERIHPYGDFNCRTFCVLVLNRELIKNGFAPAILEDPNIFDHKNIYALEGAVKEGQANFQRLRDTGIVHERYPDGTMDPDNAVWKQNLTHRGVAQQYTELTEGRYIDVYYQKKKNELETKQAKETEEIEKLQPLAQGTRANSIRALTRTARLNNIGKYETQLERLEQKRERWRDIKEQRGNNQNLTLLDKKEFQRIKESNLNNNVRQNRAAQRISNLAAKQQKDNKLGLVTDSPVTLIGESDHSKDHRGNVAELITEIKIGNIGEDRAVLLERKQAGDNFAMKDVVMLANVLVHNERHPQHQIKVPEHIEQSNVYADALLYKTAAEYGVVVVGMEGKLLTAGKSQAIEHNNAREEAMLNFISRVAENKKVVALVGDYHLESMQAGLKKQKLERTEHKALTTQMREEVIGSLKNTKEDQKFPSIHRELLNDNKGSRELLGEIAAKAYGQVKLDIEKISVPSAAAQVNKDKTQEQRDASRENQANTIERNSRHPDSRVVTDFMKKNILLNMVIIDRSLRV